MMSNKTSRRGFLGTIAAVVAGAGTATKATALEAAPVLLPPQPVKMTLGVCSTSIVCLPDYSSIKWDDLSPDGTRREQ